MNASTVPEHKEHTQSPYIMTVDNTTVRLSFNGKSDLTARLAGAFINMIG